MKSFVTLEPKSHPAPLGLTAHASTRSSGSDQTKSQKAPDIKFKLSNLNRCVFNNCVFLLGFYEANSIFNKPLWGISWFRSINLIWSRVLISGDKPPCTHKTSPSINAATVSKSNTLQQYLHALALPYFV